MYTEDSVDYSTDNVITAVKEETKEKITETEDPLLVTMQTGNHIFIRSGVIK